MQCPHVGSTDNIITIITKQTPIQGSWANKAKQNYTFKKKIYCTRVQESSEGLNSSLAQSCWWLRLAKGWPEEAYGFFQLLLKTRFFSHGFGSRHASKSIKGSKDSYSSQECEKYLGQKNGPFSQSPGPGNQAYNAKTPFHCDVDNRKLQTQPKIFFFNLRYKTCWIHRGFEHLSSSGYWQGIALQTFQIFSGKIGPTGLKGLRENVVLCWKVIWKAAPLRQTPFFQARCATVVRLQFGILYWSLRSFKYNGTYHKGVVYL